MIEYQQLETQVRQLSVELGRQLKSRGWRIACAESCTGGLLAKSITDIAGSSAYFDRGFIAYSNEAKQEMLGVDALAIERHGAVSETVVKQMANGALKLSSADLVVAMSGVTGPDGGTENKPVGTVWFCCANNEDKLYAISQRFSGNREIIRLKSVAFSIELVLTNFI